MSVMSPNDPNLRSGKKMNPLAWVAGIVATILVVMLIASYFNNRADDRYSSKRNTTTEQNVVPDEPVVPDTDTQDAH